MDLSTPGTDGTGFFSSGGWQNSKIYGAQPRLPLVPRGLQRTCAQGADLVAQPVSAIYIYILLIMVIFMVIIWLMMVNNYNWLVVDLPL